MKPLSFFLSGLVFQLWLWPSNAREAHLRKMHVVSLGVGDVECDDAHNSACGDALRGKETNGVLLLPESKNRWHAFNVHTLLMPSEQHVASISEQLSLSQGTLGKLSAQLLLGRSLGSSLVWLGLFVLIGFVLMQVCSSSDSEVEEYDEERGTWESAYNNSRGHRRDAMELLFKTGIIATQDLTLRSVSSAHIEECVQVALRMLQEGSMEEWIGSWKQAQHTFEERYSAVHKEPKVSLNIMAEFEFCDGSWARAYVMSEGHRDRQEAFQLLLRLGIVSREEFRDSLVSPTYIEERISVAMNLLKRQSLGQWVDLCETADGNEGKLYAKASVMAQFSTSGGASQPALYSRQPSSDSPPEKYSPQDYSWPEQSSDSPPEKYSPQEYSPQESNPLEVRTIPVAARSLTRGITQGLVSDHGPALVGHTPAGVSTFKTEGLYSRRVDTGYEEPGYSFVGVKAPAAETARSEEDPSASGCSSSMATPTHPPPSRPFVLAASLSPRQEPLTLPPTAFAPAYRSDKVLGGLDKSPSGAESQKRPATIKFANNAVSGSSWQGSAPKTPPGSQTFPR